VHANENDEGTYDTFPDSLVGTDSHTPMVNGLGVLGWGVGGIEAEAGMLGQPSYFPSPEVIGVKFTGSFPEGTTATRSEEHTSELQSRFDLVCRLLLEKKK